MVIVIPIVLVIYFFLLPARFEGERYAPGKAEKWIVIGSLAMAMLFFLLATVAMGDDRADFWSSLVPGILAIYALLIPVRMVFRTEIHPIEAWLAGIGIALAIVFMVILPAFSG